MAKPRIRQKPKLLLVHFSRHGQKADGLKEATVFRFLITSRAFLRHLIVGDDRLEVSLRPESFCKLNSWKAEAENFRLGTRLEFAASFIRLVRPRVLRLDWSQLDEQAVQKLRKFALDLHQMRGLEAIQLENRSFSDTKDCSGVANIFLEHLPDRIASYTGYPDEIPALFAGRRPLERVKFKCTNCCGWGIGPVQLTTKTAELIFSEDFSLESLLATPNAGGKQFQPNEHLKRLSAGICLLRLRSNTKKEKDADRNARMVAYEKLFRKLRNVNPDLVLELNSRFSYVCAADWAEHQRVAEWLRLVCARAKQVVAVANRTGLRIGKITIRVWNTNAECTDYYDFLRSEFDDWLLADDIQVEEEDDETPRNNDVKFTYEGTQIELLLPCD
ncbi:hypothetical protein M3Y99_01471600 [Aphelenchoides fujianensis]|nr:hypothetical protein M3Y99_01471600 [Aphelenchoides fujianensis]